MAYTNAWDNTAPPDTQLAKLLGKNIRDLKLDVQERLGTFLSGTYAAIPAPEASWAGLMYFATDHKGYYRWSGAAWVPVGPTFNFRSAALVQTVAAGDGIVLVLPASVLAIGDLIEVKAGFNLAAGGPIAQVKFGAGVIGGAQCVLANPPTMAEFRGIITLVGAASQYSIGSYMSDKVFMPMDASFDALGEAIAAPINVKTVQTGGAGAIDHLYLSITVFK